MVVSAESDEFSDHPLNLISEMFLETFSGMQHAGVYSEVF
jgi:hypothetical protein